MPESRADLNTNITTLAGVLTALIAAIEAALNKPEADFTDEDNSLRAAAAAAQTELDKINPPPPPTPNP